MIYVLDTCGDNISMTSKVREKVLIVDDEPYIREFLGEILSSEFQVFFAQSGKSALEVVKRTKPSIIVLDLIMSDMGGMKFCETIKKDEKLKYIPLVILSAIDDPKVRMEAFSLGAVDFVQKPFHPDELLMRVKKKLSADPVQEFVPPIEKTELQIGNLTLSKMSRSVRVKNKEVQLLEIEAQILESLLLKSGQICSRDEIAENIWSASSGSTSRNLDPHISALRKKLKGADHSIQTVYGTGYILKKV